MAGNDKTVVLRLFRVRDSKVAAHRNLFMPDDATEHPAVHPGPHRNSLDHRRHAQPPLRLAASPEPSSSKPSPTKPSPPHLAGLLAKSLSAATCLESVSEQTACSHEPASDGDAFADAVQRQRHPTQWGRRLGMRNGQCLESIRYPSRCVNEDSADWAARGDRRDMPKGDASPLAPPSQGLEAVESAARPARRPRTNAAAIEAVQLQRILNLPLDYIANEQFAEFRRRRAERAILADTRRHDEPAKTSRLPGGLPAYLASLYKYPLLTSAQETHLFRKLNYLKYKADELRQSLDLVRPRRSVMDRIEKCYAAATAVQNEIIRANLRLVVSIAKRHPGAKERFFDFVSDGNLSLMRAVEKFDFARGTRFSTYATWAITRGLRNTSIDEYRRQDRFRTSQVEILATAKDHRPDESAQEIAQLSRESRVERILAYLDERERQIIVSRFGLQRGREALTLQQIGVEMGVTKERIRQIEARAMRKLRGAVAVENSESPA